MSGRKLNSKKKIGAQKLTELELDVMKAAWSLADTVTISQVHERLKDTGTKKYAYTTIATMMKILVEKGFLKMKKAERANLYMVRVSREDYERTAVDNLVGSLLDGSPSSLVMHLLDGDKLNRAELEKIRQELNARLD